MKDVYFDFGCFATILASVVESYPQETYGFIVGEETKTRINLKMSPPLQLAIRTKESIEYEDKKNYEEVKGVIDTLGLTIIGGFHSHPGSLVALPSEKDIITAGLEHSISKKDPSSPFMEEWLELIVGIQRKKFRKKFSPTTTHLTKTDSSKKIKGELKIQNSGYIFEIMGYWVHTDEISKGVSYSTVSEVATLDIATNTFPKTWKLDY